ATESESVISPARAASPSVCRGSASPQTRRRALALRTGPILSTPQRSRPRSRSAAPDNTTAKHQARAATPPGHPAGTDVDIGAASNEGTAWPAPNGPAQAVTQPTMVAGTIANAYAPPRRELP